MMTEKIKRGKRHRKHLPDHDGGVIRTLDSNAIDTKDVLDALAHGDYGIVTLMSEMYEDLMCFDSRHQRWMRRESKWDDGVCEYGRWVPDGGATAYAAIVVIAAQVGRVIAEMHDWWGPGMGFWFTGDPSHAGSADCEVALAACAHRTLTYLTGVMERITTAEGARAILLLATSYPGLWRGRNGSHVLVTSGGESYYFDPSLPRDTLPFNLSESS